MGTRSRRRAGCALAVAVALVLATAAPAQAATPVTSGASAYSAGAATGTATLSANLQLSGSLGSLLDVLISPIVTGALDPLLNTLQGTVNTLVSSTLGTASGLNAGTPSQQYGTSPGTFPTEPVPSPCNPTGPQPCYSVTSGPTVNSAPLVTLGVGALSGWTQQIPNSADSTNPIYGRARVASVSLQALSGISSLTNPVVTTGLLDALANCPNDGPAGATKPTTAPSASVSAANVSLLGGLVTFGVANGQIANLVVNGVSYASVLALPTVNVNGATVAPYGTSIAVTVPLTPAQILSGLGLSSSVVTQLLGYAPTSTVNLTVVVGPGTKVTNTSAAAWGLGIGVDLSGSLAFNLLGLVTATVAIPTGIGGGNIGNLADLRLGYSTCQSGINSGAGTTPPAVPPALV